MEIYLDNSATTKPYAEVVEEMVKALTTEYGNPSSLHKKGIEVDRKIKEIRQNIARTLGVWLVFFLKYCVTLFFKTLAFPT